MSSQPFLIVRQDIEGLRNTFAQLLWLSSEESANAK